jgi:hypothetical protein
MAERTDRRENEVPDQTEVDRLVAKLRSSGVPASVTSTLYDGSVTRRDATARLVAWLRDLPKDGR